VIPQPRNIPISADKYRLVENYEYRWYSKNSSKDFRIIVPEGFIYDGASIPRVVWSISGLRPDGLIRAAACIHDWIYRYSGKVPPASYQFAPDTPGESLVWSDCNESISRDYADRLFRYIMRDAGVAPRRVEMAYYAVWAFGWYSW
jgi:hypothetical protein